MAFIGIGSASKYNIYILVATISKLLLDCLIGLNPLNKEHPGTFFNFIPILTSHSIFQNLLEFLGFMLASISIFLISLLINKNITKNKSRTYSDQYSDLKIKSLKQNDKKPYIDIILVSLLFPINILIRTFLYLNFLDLELWMLEIIFISFLSLKIFNIKINRHKKAAMFIVIPLLIIQFISSSLPQTKHKDKNNEDILDYNIFKIIGKKVGYYYIPILYITYISITLMRDYSWIKSKYLMDKKSISICLILFLTGLFGIILSIISFIISTYTPCKTYHNVIKDESDNYYIDNKIINLSKEICYIQDYNEIDKSLKLYYDNFLLMIDEYKVFNKDIKKELFIILPLYTIISMIKNSCHMIMIKYLEPYNILISDNLYFFINRLIVFILNKANEEYLTVGLFILMELSEIIYIISNLIYIEIIELKFCNLDYDLRKNISKRGVLDYYNEYESDLINGKENRLSNDIEVSEGYGINPEDFNLVTK